MPNDRLGRGLIREDRVDRRRFRSCLTVVVEFTRECPGIEVDTSLPPRASSRCSRHSRTSRLPKSLGPESMGEDQKQALQNKLVLTSNVAPNRRDIPRRRLYSNYTRNRQKERTEVTLKTMIVTFGQLKGCMRSP